VVNRSRGWELAGVDLGLRSFARRLLLKARVCPPPDRAVTWADLHALVPRVTDTASPGEDAGRILICQRRTPSSPAGQPRSASAERTRPPMAVLRRLRCRMIGVGGWQSGESH
jgi:hypothetical protein